MLVELKYDDRFAGAKAVAISDKATISTPTLQSNYAVQYSQPRGTVAYCTGYYYDDGSYVYPQTTSGLLLIVDLNSSDWSFEAGAIKVSDKSSKNAQAFIDKVIKNNNTILSNNLVCARFKAHLTTEQKELLYELQSRLNARNSALLDEQLCTVEAVGVPEGYAELQSYLDAFMQSGGVGSLTAAIVVSAIVIASVSTAAYFAYEYYADESDIDVKYSNELTEILTSKLTEEEYQQLLSETKGIVTKEVLKGKLRNTTTKVLMIGAGVLAALALLKIWRK